MRSLTTGVLAVALSLLVGCGKKPVGIQGLSKDQQDIINLIQSIGDYAGDTRNFKKMFVGEKAPPNKDFLYKAFFVDDPVVEGTTAKVNVRIKDTNVENAPERPKTWTVVKEGDKWKLQDAPVN